MNVSSINSSNEPAQAGILLPSEANTSPLNDKLKEEVAIASEKLSESDMDKQEDDKTQQAEDVVKAIEVIDSFLNHQATNVSFMVDEDADKLVIKVIDAKNNELIKQFPSEEILSMAKKVKGLQQEIGENTGILIDNKV